MKLLELIPILFLTLSGSCIDNTKAYPCRHTSPEGLIKANFKGFISESWNHKNLDTLSSFLSENYICRHNGITIIKGNTEMKTFMKDCFRGFPNAELQTHNTVVNKNQILAEWTFRGTNTGIFNQMLATGKKVDISGFVAVQFNNRGKILEEDIYYNELEFLQQLGYTLSPPILK